MRWTSACCRRPAGRTACRLLPHGTLLQGLRRVLACARIPWVEPADGTLAAVAIIGIRHLPPAAPRKRYIRRTRRRKGASSVFLAEQESVPGTTLGAETRTADLDPIRTLAPTRAPTIPP